MMTRETDCDPVVLRGRKSERENEMDMTRMIEFEVKTAADTTAGPEGRARCIARICTRSLGAVLTDDLLLRAVDTAVRSACVQHLTASPEEKAQRILDLYGICDDPGESPSTTAQLCERLRAVDASDEDIEAFDSARSAVVA